MPVRLFVKYARRLIASVSAAALMMFAGSPMPLGSAFAQSASQQVSAEKIPTATPIKHIIYIIGENRSFDNIYATYQPKNNQQVWNLLSRGIVNVDGSAGKNFAKARQFQVTTTSGAFFLSPQSKTPYTFLPVPTILNADAVGVGLEFDIVTANGDGTPIFPVGDPELPDSPQIQVQLATGGTGKIPANGADSRVAGFNMLPAGPFPQTGPELPYDSYEGDTIHQLFQMWQQSDCSMTHATFENPTGCLHDLYPFVATTYSTAPGQVSTDGSQDMAFYNVSQGDAPIFKSLADQFTISDNFHQSIDGGSVTGAIAIAFGDNAFYSDGNGNPLVPPGSIMNPNPIPGSVNTYISVGTWANCSDPTQPGIAAITHYLATLPYYVGPNCQANAYYAVRDANQPYNANGTLAPASATTMPPLTQRHIGDVMNEGNVPWIFYGGGYNEAVAVANGAKDLFDEIGSAGYCIECNPFQYSKQIMGNPAQIAAHLRDVNGNGTVNGLFEDIAAGTLPAVAFVKPDGALEGHPGTGKVDLLEDFIQNVMTKLQANPKLWAESAIIVSFDESGGLFDSGFIQPLDFFGDGPRMPMLVISPFSTGGRVVHSYNDQASVLKFIERNWYLGKISHRSRDNLPNPIMNPLNPWVPVNMPAIGDLFDMFDFSLASIIRNDIDDIGDELQKDIRQ